MKRLGFIGLLLCLGTVSWVLWTFARAQDGSALPQSRSAEKRHRAIGIGYVEPATEIRKLMFRTGGVIAKCLVVAGKPVRRDDVLMELDNRTALARVALARQQVETADAECAAVKSGTNPYRIRSAEEALVRLREKLRHAEREAERRRKLRESRNISEEEYQVAESQRRLAEAELREQEAEINHLKRSVTEEQKIAAEAKVRQAESALKLAEQELGETVLKAPFDGTVLKLLKREGEGVSAFVPEPVLLIGDLKHLRIRAEFDEYFAARLAVGQTAVISGHNLSASAYPGRIIAVEPLMGGKTLFAHAASERKDLEVIQAVIEMEATFRAPVGLQVDVEIDLESRP